MLTSLSPWTLHGSSSTFILCKISLDATFDVVPNTRIGIYPRFLSPPRVSFGDPVHDSGGVMIYRVRNAWFFCFSSFPLSISHTFSAGGSFPLFFHILFVSWLSFSVSCQYVVGCPWVSLVLWLSSNEGYIVVALDPLIVHSARSGCRYLCIISSATEHQLNYFRSSQC